MWTKFLGSLNWLALFLFKTNLFVVRQAETSQSKSDLKKNVQDNPLDSIFYWNTYIFIEEFRLKKIIKLAFCFCFFFSSLGNSKVEYTSWHLDHKRFLFIVKWELTNAGLGDGHQWWRLMEKRYSYNLIIVVSVSCPLLA